MPAAVAHPITSEYIRTFLETLYEPGDFFEVRILPSERDGPNRTVTIGKRYEPEFDYDGFERLLMPHHNFLWQGIYVGVNPRHSLRGSGYHGMGEDRDVVHARCLFVDFDDAAPDEALARIHNAPLPPPTLLISSGRATGTHAYWRLHEPVENMDVWKGLQRTIIRLLHSDRSIVNPSRIMRLPGTHNFTRDGACRIIRTDATYASWEALNIRPEVVLQEPGFTIDPSAPPDWNNFNGSTHEYLNIARIPEGGRGTRFAGRNVALFAAAMDFKANRIPIEDAFRELGKNRAVTRDGLAREEAYATIQNAYRRNPTPTYSRVVLPESLTALVSRINAFNEPPTGEAPPILGVDQLFQPEDPVNAGGSAPADEIHSSAVAVAVENDIQGRQGASDRLQSVIRATDLPEGQRADGRPTDPRDRPHVENVKTATTVENGRAKRLLMYKPVDQIARDMNESLGGWPKRARSTGLFVTKETRKGNVEVWPLLSPSQLFAAIHDRATVRWATGECEAEDRSTRTAVTKGEFYDWLKDNAEPSFETVTNMPHVPERPGVYYMPCPLPVPTGEALRIFLNALNPATELDRTLMLAAMLTPGWGGPPGARPVFVFSSDYGQGSGKTETAKAIGRIWGGAIPLNYEDDWSTITKSITSSDDWLARVFLFDNVKGKFGGSAIEAAVTSERISGHKMYVGTVARPNDATFFITFNMPEMSRDLAQRAVIIKLGQPSTSDFVEWSNRFLTENRLQLMADLLDILRRPDAGIIDHGNRDRWQAWQQNVLAKIVGSDTNAVAREIISRRPVVDADADESVTIIFEISKYLRSVRRDVGTDGRSITTASEIYSILTNANAWQPPDGVSLRGRHTKCMLFVRNRLTGRGVLIQTEGVRKIPIDETGAPAYGRTTGNRSTPYRWDWAAVQATLDSDSWDEIEANTRPAGTRDSGPTLPSLPV
jgi:hypothetical protein